MLRNLTYRYSFVLIALSGAMTVGCSDEDDVVLPDGQVIEFDDLDYDDDDVISTAEWSAFYPTWDLDGNGIIASSEWALPSFAQVDAGRDGYIDPSEYALAFAYLDANDDGVLDDDELLLD